MELEFLAFFTIAHTRKVKTVSRCRWPAGLSVLGRQDAFQMRTGPFPIPDPRERAHDVADLVVQKRPGSCGNEDFVTRGLNRQLIQGFHRRLRLAHASSETCEIVRT